MSAIATPGRERQVRSLLSSIRCMLTLLEYNSYALADCTITACCAIHPPILPYYPGVHSQGTRPALVHPIKPCRLLYITAILLYCRIQAAHTFLCSGGHIYEGQVSDIQLSLRLLQGYMESILSRLNVSLSLGLQPFRIPNNLYTLFHRVSPASNIIGMHGCYV